MNLSQLCNGITGMKEVVSYGTVVDGEVLYQSDCRYSVDYKHLSLLVITTLIGKHKHEVLTYIGSPYVLISYSVM